MYATPWSQKRGRKPCLLPAILRPRFWGRFLAPFLGPRKSKQELLDGPDDPDFVHLLAPAFLLQCKPPWTHTHIHIILYIYIYGSHSVYVYIYIHIHMLCYVCVCIYCSTYMMYIYSTHTHIYIYIFVAFLMCMVSLRCAVDHGICWNPGAWNLEAVVMAYRLGFGQNLAILQKASLMLNC